MPPIWLNQAYTRGRFRHLGHNPPQMGTLSVSYFAILPRSSLYSARGVRVDQNADPTRRTSSRPVQEGKHSHPTPPSMLPFLYLSFPHADYGRRTIVSVCGMGVDLAFRARTRSSWCILVRGEVSMRIVVIHHIPHLSFVVHYTLPLNHRENSDPVPC